MANRKHYTFNQMVASGYIADHYLIHKFGANFDVDSITDPETIWTAGGLYPWASWSESGNTLYIASTDANDTATITLQGLDANFDLQHEVLQLAGDTVVTSAKQYRRLDRAFYNHGAPNQGTITARVDSAAGQIVTQIDANRGQTLQAYYTVPNGYCAYLYSIDFTVQKGEDAQVAMVTRQNGGGFRVHHIAEIYQNQYNYVFTFPQRYDEQTDIDMQIVEVETNNTRVSANFELLLVKKEPDHPNEAIDPYQTL